MNKIEIPLSKSKISLLLIGALVFVILGTLFLITPDTFISPIFRNPQAIRIAGIVAVLFFGAVGVYGFKRKLMQGNMKMYGTPLSITSNTLKYNFDDLQRLIKDKLIEQKEKMPNR